MSLLTSYPLQSNDDRPRHQKSSDASRKPTDAKIQDQVIPKISLPGVKEGPLLAASSAPHVVIFAVQKDDIYHQMPRRGTSKNPSSFSVRRLSKYFPIGLSLCDTHPWVNAWMQMMMFIPLLREIFTYIPPSLASCRSFVDQYFRDVEEKVSVSRANGSNVANCLLAKYPNMVRAKDIDLQELIRTISGQVESTPESHWNVLWDSQEEFAFDRLDSAQLPPDILVGIKPQIPSGKTLLKQYFSKELACYDLDAFIERRRMAEEADAYFAYLKISGTWVQCADEQILPLQRSTSLDIPLRQGILFHYRKVEIGPVYR